MLRQLANPRLYLMILADCVLFAVSLVGAFLLRFEFVLTPEQVKEIGLILIYLIPCKLIIFHIFGLYRGMWRYTSVGDFWRLTQACGAATLLLLAILLYTYRFVGFSRAVFLVDGALTLLLTGGLRVTIRSYFTIKGGSMGIQAFPMWTGVQKGDKRILIIGAGGSGEKLLREVFDNPQLNYQVVGFLDDNSGKHGRTVHGIPVLGPTQRLGEVVREYSVEQVFISIPSATGAEMRRILETCKGCGVSYKTLPAIGEIMKGKVSIKALRDVNYEDLLRRPPVELDTTGIEEYLADRTVMVTGGGGSIGSELCRQLLRFRPSRLILVDAGETNLYNIQMELEHELRFRHYVCILGRVQNRSLMDEVFEKYRPEIIFHAAACKHVPMLEKNPWEAVFNNVMGSQVVMELAKKHGTRRFVFVSTDKAVRPTNVMGTSKRLAELILQSMENETTRYMAVRFGNVVGSSGSVIPLFRNQIRQGGPVTVTHPDITRYFMTIPEACQLILQAGALGRGGEIFVLEMGTPVKIADMARDLIRLSGKEPGRDIEIVFTGLRPGEKLHEELITDGEDVTRTRHEKIMVLKCNGKGPLNGTQYLQVPAEPLSGELEQLYRAALANDAESIKTRLRRMVPEYNPSNSRAVL